MEYSPYYYPIYTLVVLIQLCSVHVVDTLFLRTSRLYQTLADDSIPSFYQTLMTLTLIAKVILMFDVVRCVGNSLSFIMNPALPSYFQVHDIWWVVVNTFFGTYYTILIEYGVRVLTREYKLLTDYAWEDVVMERLRYYVMTIAMLVCMLFLMTGCPSPH